jgi:uncharacterized protein YdeI (YjbR/CyaY-like superfamily)
MDYGSSDAYLEVVGTPSVALSADRAAVGVVPEPSDLRWALDADPDRRRGWNNFPEATQRAFLEWILTARMPITRAARVAHAAAEAAANSHL